MSLRILFADDSMTAQNMGKKILTDAGYEVVAVSNGAAAVKKIKEQKPDIIILDIYMPGYTGLEVCDKVRSSTDTLRTPVLLTVGKMEPYRPEDANRVRADGVIIKPFEASDLLAVVKKLEERVVRKSAPVGEETILLERPPDFTEFEVPAPENHNEVHASQTTVQSTVDVPDNMATTAAFSDLLGTDTGHSLEPLPMPSGAFSAELPVPPQAVAETAPPPIEQATPAASTAEETAELHPLEAAEKVEPAAVRMAPSFVASIPDTEPIPVYREPEVSAPPEPEKPVVQASTETDAQAKALDTSAFIDPGLAIHVASFDPFTAKVDSELEKIEAIVSASEARHAEVEPEVTSQNGFAHGTAKNVSSADAEFEARVAAAMAIYDQPVEEKTETADAADEVVREPELPEPTPSFEYSPPVTAPAVEIPVETSAAEKTEPAAEATPAIETTQPVSDAPAVVEPVAEAPQPAAEAAISVGPMLVTREVTQVIPVYLEPPAQPSQPQPVTQEPISAGPRFVSMEATQVIPVYLEPPAEAAQAEPEPGPVAEVTAAAPQETRAMEEQVAAEGKAELPYLSEDGTALDTMMISAVADRILDRLKPQLIEEIARELKKKK